MAAPLAAESGTKLNQFIFDLDRNQTSNDQFWYEKRQYRIFGGSEYPRAPYKAGGGLS